MDSILKELKKKAHTPWLAAKQSPRAINEGIVYVSPCAYKKEWSHPDGYRDGDHSYTVSILEN